MKHNEFSDLEEVTGFVLREKLMEMLEDSEGASAGMMPICMITRPDGTFAQVGVFFQTDDEKIKL